LTKLWIGLEVVARGKATGQPREKREQKKSGSMKDRKVIP
jgi:hypothetical protein